MIEICTWVVLIFALLAACSFFMNLLQFHRATMQTAESSLPELSVLIPARNEELHIRETLSAALESQNVKLEVLILDDQSQDSTAEIVREIAELDDRVQLVPGTDLPEGWCGKQHACYVLAQQATYDHFLFLDADVRVTPDALARAMSHKLKHQVALLSGFPRQVVSSSGEALLIPLIHVILLTFLPFVLMRKTNFTSAAAGCGQFFLTDRFAYSQSGGHAAIKSSLHDGLTLPRAYRRAGLATDLIDGSDIAECRMYEGLLQTYQGLLKNAHEGMANGRLILPMSALLLMSFVAPPAMVLSLLFSSDANGMLGISLIAMLLSYLPRIVTAARFDRAWYSVPWFPCSVSMFVGLQFLALIRCTLGLHASWRGRAYHPSTA